MAATVVAERIGWEHSIRVVVRDIIADAVAARQDTAGLDVGRWLIVWRRT